MEDWREHSIKILWALLCCGESVSCTNTLDNLLNMSLPSKWWSMKKEGSLVYLAPLTVCIGIGKHVQFHINELTNTRIQNVALFLRQLVINGCGYCMPSPACQLKTIILMYWISLLSLDMSMIHGFMLMGMGIHVIISY